MHMLHSLASTVLDAQPAGQMLHHGSWAGGMGQPIMNITQLCCTAVRFTKHQVLVMIAVRCTGQGSSKLNSSQGQCLAPSSNVWDMCRDMCAQRQSVNAWQGVYGNAYVQ